MVRIALVVSHPIQYFAPWYRATAALSGVDLKVFYCSKLGAESYYDPGFGRDVKWDIPLLDGYDWELLDSQKQIKQLTFLKTDNPGVGSALERFAPDVVVVHGYAQRTMWRAAAWCHQHSVPLMISSDSNAKTEAGVWKRAAKRLVVGRFYRYLDGAFSSGDNNRLYHLRYGMPQERIYPGALPIDCRRLMDVVGEPASARLALRKKHGIPEDAFVVIYAGKLIPLKCASHLLQAIERCTQQGIEVWGLLVGEGAERPKLEAYIGRQRIRTVVMTGFINQSLIGSYYAASDVVTLMSSYEPKGLTVPEAGCFGCPAILSDRVGCIGPSDSARPGENAMVYPWSDIDAFAGCIIQLYKNRPLLRSMSEAARRIALSQDIHQSALRLANAATELKKAGCRT